jgi:hypothetical protein
VRNIIVPLLIAATLGLLYTRYTAVRPADEPDEEKPEKIAAISYAQPPVSPMRTPPPVDGGRTFEPSRKPVVVANDINEVMVSVAGFSPIGFKMAAVSHHIPLAAKMPDTISKGLPTFRSDRQRYGELVFSSGRRYGLILDADIEGYKLYVDLNGNGDFRDDGKPLLNKGAGVFASRLILPLDAVSINPGLDGDYEMWLFTGNKERPPASLRYYVRTQLEGQVQLPHGTFTAYLADNSTPDGDYSNDGISIDFNGDGKIELREELMAPGRVVEIGGYKYRFVVTD